ncbi:MAG TPA: helix-turn-helix domain-containing protein [Rhizomicrobium sp.]
MKKPVDYQRRRPRQARALATVDSILEAAVQVLQRSGAGGLNTNSVAERAGVSVGTLYQYFPDKEAILLAIARRELENPGAGLAALPKTLMEALVRAVESLLGKRAPARANGAVRRLSVKNDRKPGSDRIERQVLNWFGSLVFAEQRIAIRARR